MLSSSGNNVAMYSELGFLSASQHDDRVFLLLLERDRNSGCRCLYDGLLEIWWIYYSYLHPPLGAYELSGQSWQLVTAIHDDIDGQILCY
jgi:hypothetical protein